MTHPQASPSRAARRTRGKLLGPGILLLVGLAVSVVFAGLVDRQYLELRRADLEHKTTELHKEITRDFEVANYGLRGARGAMAVMGEFTVEKFRTYVQSRDLPKEFPGIRGFGWIEPVPAGQLDAYEQRLRRTDAPDFTVRHLAPPDPARQYVIRTIEPPEQNKGARGLNVGSEARRLEALQQAVDRAEFAITRQIVLVQDFARTPGLLLFVPVYRSTSAPGTIEQRRAQLAGFLYAPIVIAELLAPTVKHFDAGLCISLHDQGDPSPWFQSVSVPAANACASDVIRSPLKVGGRDLELRTSRRLPATAPWAEHAYWFALVVGAALSLALSYIFHLVLRAKERSDAVATVMSEENRTMHADLERALANAQAALQAREASESLLTRALNASGLGVWTWDVAAGLILWDRRMCEIYGLSPDMAWQPRPYDDWIRRVHPEDLALAVGRQQTLIDGQPVATDREYRIVLPDGEVRYVMANSMVERDEQGREVRLVGFNQDVTARHQLEGALRDKEHFMRSLIDVLPGMVGFWDEDLVCGFANKSYLEWFDKTPEQMIGLRMQDLMGPELFARNEPFIRAALAGHPQRFERTLVKADGTTGFTWAHYIPHLVDGRPSGFFVQVSDVTALKTIQLELEASNRQLEQRTQEAEAATRSTSTFLATMSHEIRTPLNAIVGTSYLLGIGKLSEEQARDVQAIASASKSLLALVNDILDFSKIEAKELVLEHKPFAVADVLVDMRAMFASMAARKDLDLVIEQNDPQVPVVVVGDGDRLRQILTNLLSNAIKFTRQGRVALSVATVDGPDVDCPRLRFAVTDTGVGIPEAFRDRLFEPFVQADSSTSRVFGGTGLGLSIVKRLVELMGGRVEVDSRENEGSCFTVEIPFGRSAANASARHEAFLLPRSLHILVAEDDPIERRVLMRSCSEFGWHVEGTDNGADMVDLVERRLQEGNPVDCLVLDWRMPKLDGVQTLELLAKRIRPPSMPSAIMVTANDRDALRKALREVQPNSILTKPVDRSLLFNAVNEAVVAHGAGLSHILNATVIQGGQAQWLAGVAVLVVDDSVMNLEVIRRILASEGAIATVCSSGPAALEVLASGATFDVMLMDLQMPGSDGFETTRRIRQMPPHDQTPIIALTAGATVTEKERALACGMVDFLTKPVDPSRLIRVLREHIETRRATPLPIAPLQSPVADAAHAPSRPADREGVPWPEIAGIDSALAARLTGSDPEFFQEMLALFRTEHGQTLARLEAFVHAGQRFEAGHLAHKLKGQAGNLGATALQGAADRFEQAALDPAADLASELKALAAWLHQVMGPPT